MLLISLLAVLFINLFYRVPNSNESLYKELDTHLEAGGQVCNVFFAGGYILFHGYPEVLPLMDNRVELYPDYVFDYDSDPFLQRGDIGSFFSNYCDLIVTKRVSRASRVFLGHGNKWELVVNNRRLLLFKKKRGVVFP